MSKYNFWGFPFDLIVLCGFFALLLGILLFVAARRPR